MPRRHSRPAIAAARWARIRLFAMDVDGVLTDGTIAVSSTGGETKVFSVLDGLGLRRVRAAGLEIAWISGRTSTATSRRARELKIRRVLQGNNDKLAVLRKIAGQLGLTAAECLYMGDDDIDVPALLWAGIGVAVPNALPAALDAADCITIREGGRGAVRQVCDRLLASRKGVGP